MKKNRTYCYYSLCRVTEADAEGSKSAQNYFFAFFPMPPYSTTVCCPVSTPSTDTTVAAFSLPPLLPLPLPLLLSPPIKRLLFHLHSSYYYIIMYVYFLYVKCVCNTSIPHLMTGFRSKDPVDNEFVAKRGSLG